MSAYDLACLDGTVVPIAEAVVPATDEGLLRGDGMFEVIRLYGGLPFGFGEHLERMTGSAANLRLPFAAEDVAADVRALLAAATPGDCALRVLVTRGGHRLALLEPLADYAAPIRLASVTYAPTRILDGVKSLSYAANMLAGRLAREQGADEGLLVTPHGRILEASTSSIFYVLDGDDAVYTPPLADHILDSITRRHVVAASGARERVTASEDVRWMREAFLASTLREVQPIGAIDGHALPAPGPRTAAIRADVAARLRALAAAP